MIQAQSVRRYNRCNHPEEFSHKMDMANGYRSTKDQPSCLMFLTRMANSPKDTYSVKGAPDGGSNLEKRDKFLLLHRPLYGFSGCTVHDHAVNVCPFFTLA